MDAATVVNALRELPFVADVSPDDPWVVRMVNGESVGVELRLVGGVLSRERLAPLVLSPEIGGAYVLVVADRITAEAARALRHLVESERAPVWHFDRGGNHLVHVGTAYYSSVDGQPVPAKPAVQKEIRSAGYRALFALMCEPSLVGESERTIAEAAGVSRTAAATMARRLRELGHVVTVKGSDRVVLSPELLDMWLVGYRSHLRPTLFVRSYAPPRGGPSMLPKRLGAFLSDGVRWGLGGNLGALGLGGEYPGTTAAIHIEDLESAKTVQLPLDPDDQGPIAALGVPGPLAIPERGKAVHPLLVVAELMMARDPRTLAMGRELVQRFGLAGGSA